MIWSHFPCRMEKNDTVGCPIEVPNGTWYMNKVVCGLVLKVR